jgi:CRISPR/Cas system-associated endonuclease Cas1
MDKNIRRSKIQVLVDKADEIEFKIGSLTDDINLLLNREVRINIQYWPKFSSTYMKFQRRKFVCPSDRHT